MPKSGNIAFVYSATGEKLRKTLVPLKANGQIETQEAIDVTDYMGEYIYRNNILSRIINTEGACVRQSNGSFVYEYDMKDHLGNTRVTFSDVNNDWTIDPNTEVSQINHYYPYGLNMVGNWNGQNGQNKYQYNNKEWNDDYGLGWNDYGARFYDPAVVRWWNLDPECESGDQPSVNPYHYVYDNPIRHTDPNGREPDDIVLRGANNSSLTIKTDLIDVSVDIGSLVGDLGGNRSVSGDDILQAALDLVGLADPTPISDGINAGISAKKGNWGDAAISSISIFPYLGDFAKVGKVEKDLKIVKNAMFDITSAGKKVDLSTGQKLGPSGKPMVHTIEKSSKKEAKDAARHDRSNGAKSTPVKHTKD